MKRINIFAIAAALLLATGCASSPSSDRYSAAEPQSSGQQTAEPTQSEGSASGKPVETEAVPSFAAQPESSPTDPIPSAGATDDQPRETKGETKKKPTKAEQSMEAKKKNESVGKAVTDSIMDNGTDQADAKSPQADRLKKSVDQLRALVKDLKQHAEDKDSALMKEVSASISQSWNVMKPDVEASVPDMVPFIDEKIAKLDELQKAESIDQEAMLQLDYEMYQAFRQLADKAGL
ncbi:hypothetical protein ACFPPD_18160 [Cohnella suwonensis]|uniref:Lipoprotein n=1 Tax=Cohnella suwonensis TaxID=696072 RepID=A0ABW0LZ91_9BACL